VVLSSRSARLTVDLVDAGSESGHSTE